MQKKQNKGKNTVRIAVIGSLLVAVILIVGTVWMGQSAKKDTETAVHSVSLLYLGELAGRREQVVASNLQKKIDDIKTAVELMTDEDLSDTEHLQAYQARMKRIYNLEKFAFVDTDGVIYTSKGTQTNIDEYQIDYQSITEPEISIFNLDNSDKKVIVAIPIEGIGFEGKTLSVCFMEIDMDEMLEGVSMEPDTNGSTFCNIYTKDGVPLTNAVLGGLAEEDNLLEAMQHADYEDGYTYEKLLSDFENGESGVVSFSYDGIQETLSYVPVKGTDWFLTYLIRESVISDSIGAVSGNIVTRSLIQSVLTAVVLIMMFIFILTQTRKNAKLTLEKEATDIENRVKQEEMEQKLVLQEKLLAEEMQRTQQTRLITALSSDYWSVYYLELDTNEGVCYQSHSDVDNGFKVGEHFNYLEAVTEYARRNVTEKYREEFLRFIQPDAIREGLKTNRVISFRYTVFRHGKESYEMVRFAGVRHPEDRDDHIVHAVGGCFTDVDEETRRSIAQNEALENALAAAEQANKAKTAFLSNMSHEIRTPMNAIIGLDNIALNDPDISPKTRDYLIKIGDSAEHLLQLINDILDMSRIESGRMLLKNEEFSFSKLLEYINTVFSGQCADNGLDYQCHITGHVDDHYIGDSMKLRQVLINILGNAVKFTPAGGSVSMTVERTAQFEGKSTLRFTIKDTGIGISEEFLPHIFDTFAQEENSSTNKYGSSGLGLAITKSIVEMMNGNIHVESEKGKGTVFTVTVTLRDTDELTAADNEIEIDPREMIVLIVDDDSVACEHAKLVLEKAGIASELASSGEEAIEKVKLHHARRAPYNLILVDWKMPGMDGVEATRRIREIVGNESAIIMLTAYKWDDVLDEAIQAGVDSFIAKPLFAANVLDEFKSALKRKGVMIDNDAQNVDLNGRRVLLAEDVDINAEIIMMTLQMEGVEAERASNGKIAVEMFLSHPEGYYDAVLMDMRMPEMDGLEATRTIRRADRPDAKTVPIIALTANAYDEDVQRSLQAGLNAHLSKPVKPEELFRTLREFIRS
ncbi:MAG: response regulator [Ruminococcus sp.]|uniref:hybrid sensor histidine kinase/response regulator n=1 Tax=Ruminococcus sp. TaxID=41978 RepID=UPI00287344BB|nr:response regulator [Ruminococcus sp.]MBQ3285880.1 response regulator [Ruminococcus sp.]